MLAFTTYRALLVTQDNTIPMVLFVCTIGILIHVQECHLDRFLLSRLLFSVFAWRDLSGGFNNNHCQFYLAATGN